MDAVRRHRLAVLRHHRDDADDGCCFRRQGHDRRVKSWVDAGRRRD